MTGDYFLTLWPYTWWFECTFNVSKTLLFLVHCIYHFEILTSVCITASFAFCVCFTPARSSANYPTALFPSRTPVCICHHLLHCIYTPCFPLSVARLSLLQLCASLFFLLRFSCSGLVLVCLMSVLGGACGFIWIRIFHSSPVSLLPGSLHLGSLQDGF